MCLCVSVCLCVYMTTRAYVCMKYCSLRITIQWNTKYYISYTKELFYAKILTLKLEPCYLECFITPYIDGKCHIKNWKVMKLVQQFHSTQLVINCLRYSHMYTHMQTPRTKAILGIQYTLKFLSSHWWSQKVIHGWESLIDIVRLWCYNDKYTYIPVYQMQ